MKQRILFLAANPAGTTALRLDEESRAIQEEIRRASQRDQFEFETRLAARPMDLLRALRDVKPAIVHFAGHAETEGIYLTSDAGAPVCVDRGALVATFGAAGQSVRVVVLNACATDGLAEALCEFVSVCVGTSAAVRDEAARMFSIGFYGALASGESAERARLHGLAAMRLAAAGDAETPLLRHHRDIDPDKLGFNGDPSLSAGAAAYTTHHSPVVASSATASAASPATVSAEPTPAARSAVGTDLIAPLVLLQLSDLHFGPHSRFAGCDLERLAAQCRQALDEARGDLGWCEAIGLVLVTGDIAEAARPPEYADAASFFVALAKQLALPRHRFVFVPGNHDVSWTKCREIDGQLEDGAFPASELRARLDAVKFAHFERFLREFHGGRGRHEVDGASVTPLVHGAFIHEFADLGVSVAALNSCERESHRSEDHVGAVSADQVQAVLDHWRGSQSTLLRIAAVHHNPAAMASAPIEQWLEFLRCSTAQVPVDVVERIATNFVGFEGHEYLRNLAGDAHASLIFHGHHHASTSHQAWAWRGRDASGAGDARILSAGSWGLSPDAGKLPKDQPVVMHLVRLDPTAAELRAALLTYDPTARLPGEVRCGRFQLDGQTRADRPLQLSLPPALRGRLRAESDNHDARDAATAGSLRPRLPELAAVIPRYRERKAGAFERWDLRTAGPQPTVGNRPTETTLDEMYIPLRFAAELDVSKNDRGSPITVEDSIGRRRPQVVIGGAGSGKTTWMRWTFRRLIRDPRVMPFFLELRAIAAEWKTPQQAGRSVESYLSADLNGCGASDPDSLLVALLADLSGPRPVVLIDGWDELGAQGERLRERLVEFCRAHPHVVVVVSSRPYGETRPAGAEAFDTLYIQPLSDGDVRLLATRFHHRVHGLDEAAGARATEEFMAALAAAPDARSLAGTALLLTMMLLLSREGPLPDRRHKLYTACLRNMLLHRVTQREREGAVLDADQWRPDDSEERLRVVAELAYRMQTEGYKSSRRASIVRSWDSAVGLLKASWTSDQRDQFLRWLVASAGVLVDRADGSVHFAHLSFQEHLAAYYLFIAREGDERIAAVREHMTDPSWWETLRLWAGLTGDHWPDKLAPVLTMLRESGESYWLAGMIFADGTGATSDFQLWARELPSRLSDPFAQCAQYSHQCALAWGACKQLDRRAAISLSLRSARAGLNWLEAAWHAEWCELANLDVERAPALVALEVGVESAGAVSRSRAILGSTARMPDGGELALLRLWPSLRATVSAQLQSAASLGARRDDLVVLFPALLSRTTRWWTTEWHAAALDSVQRFVGAFKDSFEREFGLNPLWMSQSFVSAVTNEQAMTGARYFAHYPARELARGITSRFVPRLLQLLARDFGMLMGHGLAQRMSSILGHESGRPSDRQLGDYLAQLRSDRNVGVRTTSWRELCCMFGADLTWDRDRTHSIDNFAGDLKRSWIGMPEGDAALEIPEQASGARWLPAFRVLDTASTLGHGSTRAAIAYNDSPPGAPLLALFHLACQASLAPSDESLRASVDRACRAFEGDPLWPALARHVARISDAADRALLEELARHPEQRSPPLSWGLQFYVRGDLQLDDDTFVTFDELGARAGVPALPLLDPMPDELDLSKIGILPPST